MICNRCNNEFEPTQYQIKKHSRICVPCRSEAARIYKNNRRSLGLLKEWSVNWTPEIKRKWEVNYRMKRRENPEEKLKYEARLLTFHAVKSGKLNKAPCAICGKPQAQAHHIDYNKPLIVVWLCAKCHHTEHNKLPKTGE